MFYHLNVRYVDYKEILVANISSILYMLINKENNFNYQSNYIK